MEKAEPRHRWAMDELQQLDDEQPAPVTRKGTLQQQQKANREELEKKCERIDGISQGQRLIYSAKPVFVTISSGHNEC